MRKNIVRLATCCFVLSLLVELFACHQRISKYQNRDKWMLVERMTRMVLRGRPKSVTQYVYPAVDTLHPEKLKIYYDCWGFSPEGDISYRHSYMYDSPFMSFDYWIDRDGQQEKITEGSSGKVTLSRSRRRSDGSYLRIVPHAGGDASATVERFMAGGDEKITERYSDSTATGELVEEGHVYYDGNRLVRVTSKTGQGAQEARFFYSSFDAPDSMWTYQDGLLGRTLFERQLFYHNGHGDVVREIIIRGKDTTSFEQYTYTYDARGNWVRRVSVQRIKEKQPYYSPGSGAMIEDRKIVY